jgi:hypothetical protein
MTYTDHISLFLWFGPLCTTPEIELIYYARVLNVIENGGNRVVNVLMWWNYVESVTLAELTLFYGTD